MRPRFAVPDVAAGGNSSSSCETVHNHDRLNVNGKAKRNNETTKMRPKYNEVVDNETGEQLGGLRTAPIQQLICH